MTTIANADWVEYKSASKAGGSQCSAVWSKETDISNMVKSVKNASFSQ